MSGDYKLLKVDKRRGIAFIGLNRQDCRNALNVGILQEIVRAFQEADQDPEVRVIVVYSLVNGVFSAGADLKERTGMNEEQVKKRRAFAAECYEKLERVEKPTIAAIDGKNIGGGGEIAGSCDIIVASERATFRYTEVTVGSVGATQRITKLVGRQRATELLLTGREIDSEEALRIGLIARRFKTENFMEQVEEMAAVIASRPPLSVSLSKKVIKMAGEVTLQQGVLYEQMAIEVNIHKGKWREGLAGFGGNNEAQKQK